MKKYSLLLIGLLSIIAGVFAWVNPLEVSVAVTVLLGWFNIFLALALFFSDRRAADAATRRFVILFAVIMLIIGIALVANPLAGVITIGMLIAVLLLISGIARLSFAFNSAGYARGIMVISGIFSVLLAVLIFADFPQSAAVMLGVILAVELVLNGISAITLWASGKRFDKI